MTRTDRKLQRLAALCTGKKPVDLELPGRLVDLAEHRAGSVAAPAGCAGQWVTRVLAGEIATTEPPARWRPPDVVSRGTETALVAVTDPVLLTAADLPLVAVLLPEPAPRSAPVVLEPVP